MKVGFKRTVTKSPDPPFIAIRHSSALGSVLRNSAANFVRIGASWGVALILPPLLVRVLVKPAYASWILILQVSAYVGFFDAGIQNAVGRFTARAVGMQDREYMGRMLGAASVVNWVLAGLTAISTLLGFWLLPRVFVQIPPSIVSQSQYALLIVGLSLAAGLPFSTRAGAFFGLQMNHVNALAGGAGKIAGAMGAAWAAYHHQGLIVMALWIGFGYAVQSAIYAVAFRRLSETGPIRFANVDSSAMREFMHFCYALIVTQFGALLITGLDMPIVAKFDFHNAAYYAIAASAANLLVVPHGAILSTFIPIASGIHATSSPDRLGQIVIKITRLSNCVLGAMVLFLIFVMPMLLRLWVGKDYGSNALNFALILTVAQFVRLSLASYANVGFAAGQQDRMLISPLAEGLVNLACSLCGILLWGAIGVAYGTLIGAFAGILLHFVNSMKRTDAMKFDRRELLVRGILQPVLCFAPSALLLTFVMKRLASPVAQVALVCAGEVLALAIVWSVVLTRAERRAVAVRIVPFLSKNRNATFPETT